MPAYGHAHSFRVQVAHALTRTGATRSELDHSAQTKNPGIVRLHAGGIKSAPTGIDHVLRVEFGVQPAGRLPTVPEFDRNFVATGIRAEGGRIHVGRAHADADFVL